MGGQVSEASAKKHWDFWYEWLGRKCAHGADCKTYACPSQPLQA